MNKKLLSIIVTGCITLTACQSINDTKLVSEDNNNILKSLQNNQNNQTEAINSINTSLQASLTENNKQLNLCIQKLNDQTTDLNDIKKDLKNLKSSMHNSSNVGSMENSNSINDGNDGLKTSDGKLIFGSTEWIYIAEADTVFESRIDTGASVSSISALNITNFERDGHKWCRFEIPLNNGQSIKAEAPWVRNAVIIQASTDGKKEERPVVKMTVKVGNYTGTNEFTLRNRASMQYALLIGREFIKDIAVVDVSKDLVQPKNKAKNSVSGLKYDKEKDLILQNTRNVEINKEDSSAKEVVQAKPKTVEKDNSSEKANLQH